MKSTMNKNYVYISGKFVPYEEILAPVSLYAYGAYTSIKYTPDGLLFMEKHLDRLRYNCQELYIPYPGDDKIVDAIKETLDFNEARNKELILRVNLFPESISWANPHQIKNTPCAIMVNFREMYYLPQNYTLKTVNFTRNLPHLKTTNYVVNFMAKAQAREQNCHDAVLVNKEGNITEGTAWNIFFIKDSKVFTPPSESGLLKGITREAIINICSKLKIELVKKVVPVTSINEYESAFITNASQGPHAVMQIDNVMYSIDNPTLTAIKEEFNKIPLAKLD